MTALFNEISLSCSWHMSKAIQQTIYISWVARWLRFAPFHHGPDVPLLTRAFAEKLEQQIKGSQSIYCTKKICGNENFPEVASLYLYFFFILEIGLYQHSISFVARIGGNEKQVNGLAHMKTTWADRGKSLDKPLLFLLLPNLGKSFQLWIYPKYHLGQICSIPPPPNMLPPTLTQIHRALDNLPVDTPKAIWGFLNILRWLLVDKWEGHVRLCLTLEWCGSEGPVPICSGGWVELMVALCIWSECRRGCGGPSPIGPSPTDTVLGTFTCSAPSCLPLTVHS